ncbi:MAG: UDP-N-acetylmuramoyl-L-alanine--D-glutamate ligase [Planctomycetota bacterium]|nr:MAG: UDP-N-acetylmuramoyl-L-alanine--D-glutamate ligase [Planctomycetota bacterium]
MTAARTALTAHAPLDLSGVPVTVMGLGLFGGGAATVRWLARRGARITVTDLRSAEALAPTLASMDGIDAHRVLGRHRTEDFTAAEVVVANPAVPPSSPYLAAAHAAGTVITSEMALFLQHCPARIALVSGTQGKSSTCHFLAQFLADLPERVHLGGNIGASLLDVVEGMRASDIAVVEISSYQLEALPEPARDPHAVGPGPDVRAAALTNVLADHLERHGTRAAYAAAKARILELLAPDGVAFLPAGDARFDAGVPAGARIVRHGSRARSATEAGPRELALEFEGGVVSLGEERLASLAGLPLAGEFQRANAALALGIARTLGATPDSLAAAIEGLKGLPHRLEELGDLDGRRVVDNGVSTTPDSTIAALEALGRPCTLLCGGQAKRDLPLDDLARVARRREVRAIPFGAARELLAGAFTAESVAVHGAATLAEAVALAYEHTPPGGCILFSPACASFDAYANFRERALEFRALVTRRA